MNTITHRKTSIVQRYFQAAGIYIVFFFCLFQTGISVAQGIWPLKKRVASMPKAFEYPTSSETNDRRKGNLPWVVFSDRPDNFTTAKRKNATPFKSLKWLEPMVVLKERNGFLSVAKYEPELLKGRKVKDKKRLIAYGWIDKSKLLLSQSSFVNMQSGFPEKAITMINGQLPLRDPQLFFDQNDSVLVYKSPLLTEAVGKVRLHELTYRYKLSADGKSVLIGNQHRIWPDSARKTIEGWVSTQVLQSWGDRTYLAGMGYPANTWLGKNKDLPLIGFPVSYNKSDSLILKAATDVYDKSNNSLITISGASLTYPKYLKIHENLPKINVIWVIDGGSAMRQYFGALTNIVQSLETDFRSTQSSHPIHYGAVVYRDDENCTVKGLSSMPALTPDYRRLMEFLKAEAIKTTTCTNDVKAVPLYDAVREAIDLCKDRKDESNLIVIVGSVGDYTTNLKQLPLQIAAHNARILTVQMYSEYNEWYNNFVLNAKKLVSESAVFAAADRKNYVIDAEGLNQKQLYNTSQLDSISYYLDFPNNSLVQGGVVFPTKGEVISKKQLSAAVRRFMNETQVDIAKQLNSLDSAFRLSGIAHENVRDRFFTQFGGADDPSLGDAMPHNNFKFGETVRGSEHSEWLDSMQHVVILNRLEYSDLLGVMEKLVGSDTDYSTHTSRKALLKQYELGLINQLPQIDKNTIRSMTLQEYFKKMIGINILNDSFEHYQVGDILSSMSDDMLKSYQVYLKDTLEKIRMQAKNHQIMVKEQPYYFLSENTFMKTSLTQ